MGLLTDGVEVKLPHEVLEAEILRAAWSTHLEPRRLALWERFDPVSAGYLVERLCHRFGGNLWVASGQRLALGQPRNWLGENNLGGIVVGRKNGLTG
jgi:hypothetical protein